MLNSSPVFPAEAKKPPETPEQADDVEVICSVLGFVICCVVLRVRV